MSHTHIALLSNVIRSQKMWDSSQWYHPYDDRENDELETGVDAQTTLVPVVSTDIYLPLDRDTELALLLAIVGLNTVGI